MFGFQYVKSDPMTYMIQYRNGRVVRQGAGLSMFYYRPTSSLVALPMASVTLPFMFTELSTDYQEASIQGQLTYRISDPDRLSSLLNFTLDAKTLQYSAEDPQKLSGRVLNAAQVALRSSIQGHSLEDLMSQSDALVQRTREALLQSDALPALGLQLISFAILAVKPNPETARALEATVREQILKQADDALYARRNASILQERSIKENELNTDIAIQEKKLQVRQAELNAEQAALEKRQEIKAIELQGQIRRERENATLTELRVANSKQEADARAYATRALFDTVRDADPRLLQALAMGNAEPGALIASAFQELAQKVDRIGELNISPDLLQSLIKPIQHAGRD